jgi:cbb3-type cytochrome oxidase subunit 3
MKTKFLWPQWGRPLGYILAIPGFVLGYLYLFQNYTIPGFGLRMREKDSFFQQAFENFTNELAIFMVVIGLILIAFSRNKKEDELNAKLRLNALYWGIATYYAIYVLAFCINVFLIEIPFISEHMLELNIFTPLLIFIGRFNFLKYIDKEIYSIGQPKLFSNRPTKKLGMMISTISSLLLIAALIVDPKGPTADTLFNFMYLSFLIGLILWAFSKNKKEDEMTSQQRLESLQLAVYFNYGLLLVATLLYYSVSFMFVLTIANFSLLLFFVIRLEYVNYRNNRLLNTFEGGIGS